MNKLVSLKKIKGNKALLFDLKKENKSYEVELNADEIELYQSMLDEAKEEELEEEGLEEETGVFVFYNSDTNKLEDKSDN